MTKESSEGPSWRLGEVVARLRAAAPMLDAARRVRGRPVLPSREALVGIVRDLRAVLLRCGVPMDAPREPALASIAAAE